MNQPYVSQPHPHRNFLHTPQQQQFNHPQLMVVSPNQMQSSQPVQQPQTMQARPTLQVLNQPTFSTEPPQRGWSTVTVPEIPRISP